MNIASHRKTFKNCLSSICSHIDQIKVHTYMSAYAYILGVRKKHRIMRSLIMQIDKAHYANIHFTFTYVNTYVDNLIKLMVSLVGKESSVMVNFKIESSFNTTLNKWCVQRSLSILEKKVAHDLCCFP